MVRVCWPVGDCCWHLTMGVPLDCRRPCHFVVRQINSMASSISMLPCYSLGCSLWYLIFDCWPACLRINCYLAWSASSSHSTWCCCPGSWVRVSRLLHSSPRSLWARLTSLNWSRSSHSCCSLASWRRLTWPRRAHVRALSLPSAAPLLGPKHCRHPWYSQSQVFQDTFRLRYLFHVRCDRPPPIWW